MRISELAGRFGQNRDATIAAVDAAGRRREITHAELAERSNALAKALVSAGVQTGHVIGIRAKNCIEWVVWDLATIATGAVLQAFPDETPIEDADAFRTEHGLALLVTDDPPPSRHPLVLLPHETPTDARVPPTARRIDDADVHGLVYSSGTSGRLKGLVISRSGSEPVVDRFQEHFSRTADDLQLIFLPLANYQQRLSVYGCLWTGADIVFVPFPQAFGAMRTERPTYLIAPPLFYDAALERWAETGDGQSLGDWLGGRIRFMITGMAPIRRATLDAFWAADIQLFEAYGMTECGIIAWNTPAAHRVGTVGRFVDPDAMELAPDGELLIRRELPLSLGYFEADADTARQTFRPDGAIATGDFGELDEHGFVHLKGRKKDVIPLADGRKIHPAVVESVLARVDGIAEVVVVPRPGSHGLGALIMPEPPQDEPLRTAIADGIERINEEAEPHQRVTSLVFTERPMRSDPRFLTKNLKLSRPAAAAYFAERAGTS